MGFGFHTYYSDMVDRPTCVYRVYDESTLLYVGLSMNPNARLEKHRRREWWPATARVEVEWFDGREDAKTAERSAIYHEKPLHNVTRPRMECC